MKTAEIQEMAKPDLLHAYTKLVEKIATRTANGGKYDPSDDDNVTRMLSEINRRMPD